MCSKARLLVTSWTSSFGILGSRALWRSSEDTTFFKWCLCTFGPRGADVREAGHGQASRPRVFWAGSFPSGDSNETSYSFKLLYLKAIYLPCFLTLYLVHLCLHRICLCLSIFFTFFCASYLLLPPIFARSRIPQWRKCHLRPH